MSTIGAMTIIHRHASGIEAIAAAHQRARNTTIIIGADQSGGALLLDIDVQADVCADPAELREQLMLIASTLDGQVVFGEEEE